MIYVPEFTMYRKHVSGTAIVYFEIPQSYMAEFNAEVYKKYKEALEGYELSDKNNPNAELQELFDTIARKAAEPYLVEECRPEMITIDNVAYDSYASGMRAKIITQEWSAPSKIHFIED